jgi:hypothetical protein
MPLNEHVGLLDALQVLIVRAERRDARCERAATRFAGRVMLERRRGLAEAGHVLALAEALPHSRAGRRGNRALDGVLGSG